MFWRSVDSQLDLILWLEGGEFGRGGQKQDRMCDWTDSSTNGSDPMFSLLLLVATPSKKGLKPLNPKFWQTCHDFNKSSRVSVKANWSKNRPLKDSISKQLTPWYVIINKWFGSNRQADNCRAQLVTKTLRIIASVARFWQFFLQGQRQEELWLYCLFYFVFTQKRNSCICHFVG